MGVHLLLGCNDCHVDDRMLRGASEDCMVCHGKDDPHNGFLTLAKTAIPRTSGLRRPLVTILQFPLKGVHRLVDCRSCHNQATMKLYQQIVSGAIFLMHSRFSHQIITVPDSRAVNSVTIHLALSRFNNEKTTYNPM